MVTELSIQPPIYLYTQLAIIHGNSRKCCKVDHMNVNALYMIIPKMSQKHELLSIYDNVPFIFPTYLFSLCNYGKRSTRRELYTELFYAIIDPYLVFLHFTVLLSLYILLHFQCILLLAIIVIFAIFGGLPIPTRYIFMQVVFYFTKRQKYVISVIMLKDAKCLLSRTFQKSSIKSSTPLQTACGAQAPQCLTACLPPRHPNSLWCLGGRQALRHCAFTVNPHRPVSTVRS